MTAVENEKCCFNCVFCSMRYPDLREVCDKTGELLRDVYTECCGMFELLDDSEDDGGDENEM